MHNQGYKDSWTLDQVLIIPRLPRNKIDERSGRARTERPLFLFETKAGLDNRNREADKAPVDAGYATYYSMKVSFQKLKGEENRGRTGISTGGFSEITFCVSYAYFRADNVENHHFGLFGEI